MKIAVFSDIHSNRHALQTVLETIEKESVDVVACAGDLVGYGPHPNEVIDEIKRRGFPTIMGNYDEGVGFDRDDCGCAYSTPVEVETGRASLQWTKAEVTADNKAFLRSLPSQVLWEREDERILMVHGSPRRINEYLYADRRTDTIERMLKPLDIDALIMGHTHLPYHRIVDGVHLINDGSVGRPKDGDTRACYAVIDTGDDYRVEFRRVPYPVEEVAEAMNERGLPRWLSEYLRYAGKMP